MATDVLAPFLGDFVACAEVAFRWKKRGEWVDTGNLLLSLEPPLGADEHHIDVLAPSSGKLVEVYVSVGDEVEEGELLARIG